MVPPSAVTLRSLPSCFRHPSCHFQHKPPLPACKQTLQHTLDTQEFSLITSQQAAGVLHLGIKMLIKLKYQQKLLVRFHPKLTRKD